MLETFLGDVDYKLNIQLMRNGESNLVVKGMRKETKVHSKFLRLSHRTSADPVIVLR